jgi:molybdopterin synthase sulfur carrier subunit
MSEGTLTGLERVLPEPEPPLGVVSSQQPVISSFDGMGPTPTITIHVPGPLRAYCAGAAQLSIPANTVRAALRDLERSQSALYRNVCDETGTLRRHLNVFVNSDNVRDLDGIDTTLRPGDVVTILPAVSGG